MTAAARRGSYSNALRSCFQNAEPPDAGLACAGEQGVAGLSEEMWKVDHGQRIGAQDVEPSPGRKARQRTARPQYRHGAFEPAKIEISGGQNAGHARHARLFCM